MNLEAVRFAVHAVADKVAEALRLGVLPLVLGGDCTVELGTVLGWRRHRRETTLLYVDPHPDLNTPAAVPDGAFDWMGMAHLLGEPGARDELVHLDGSGPALASGDVLLFGYDAERATPHERAAIARRGLVTVEQAVVAAIPRAPPAGHGTGPRRAGRSWSTSTPTRSTSRTCRWRRTRTATWACHSTPWRRRST